MLNIPGYSLLLMSLLACRTALPPESGRTVPVSSHSRNKSVQPEMKSALNDHFIESLLAGDSKYFSNILNASNEYKVQIIYTEIDRKPDNSPVFTPHYYNVTQDSYFYPASTVKMPVALLALERLKELGIHGLDRNTAMITDASYSGQTAVLNDPSAEDGVPSVGNYVKKIFLVSDNDAYNRLYEFLGQEYINKRLKEKGFVDADILHRLEISLTEEENRHTNPIKFIDSTGKLLYEQPLVRSNLKYPKRKETVGTGYYKGAELINKPFNFSSKNRFTLEDLDRTLKSILFPGAPGTANFNLNKEDLQFVRKYMSELPRESNFPQYDPGEYHDTFVKFLLYGSDSTVKIPGKHFRIFNKPGDAYGFLTDIAYIVDFDRGVEFMLSATIYCNSDGILNDSKYDYETIGFPFMKKLGEVIYNYEKGRKRAVIPDLSEFRLDYDKR
jgi:hypothetical protein